MFFDVITFDFGIVELFYRYWFEVSPINLYVLLTGIDFWLAGTDIFLNDQGGFGFCAIRLLNLIFDEVAGTSFKFGILFPLFL